MPYEACAITAAIESLSGRAAADAPRCHSADATSMSFFDLKGRTNAGEAVDFASHKANACWQSTWRGCET